MLERSTTETIGCFATNQIGIASSASTKKITSIVLISLVPYLKLRRKIAKKINVSMSVIHPPRPAPPCIWRAKIIPVVIEKINQEKLAPDAKKIILSNLSQDADVERGNKLGISGYIVKASSTPSEVLDKVNKIMEQK